MFEKIAHYKNSPFYTFFARLSFMIIPGLIILFILRYFSLLRYSILYSKPIFYFYKVIMLSSKAVLALLGFDAKLVYTDQIYYYPVFALQIGNGGYVFMGISCLGILLMAPFAALIIAYPGKAKSKLWFIAVGCLIIQLLNILRIALLTLFLDYYNIDVNKGVSVLGIFKASHHDIFNFIIFVVIFLMFMIWVKKYGDKPQPVSNQTIK